MLFLETFASVNNKALVKLQHLLWGQNPSHLCVVDERSSQQALQYFSIVGLGLVCINPKMSTGNTQNAPNPSPPPRAWTQGHLHAEHMVCYPHPNPIQHIFKASKIIVVGVCQLLTTFPKSITNISSLILQDVRVWWGLCYTRRTGLSSLSNVGNDRANK